MQANGRQPYLDGAAVHYEHHLSEQTTLYRLVQQLAQTFLARTVEPTDASPPQFVKGELDAFLEMDGRPTARLRR